MSSFNMSPTHVSSHVPCRMSVDLSGEREYCIYIYMYTAWEGIPHCCCHKCDADSVGVHGGADGSMVDGPADGRDAAGAEK